MKVGLWKIAHARSGDKADRSDIGLFAYDAPTYAGAQARSDARARRAAFRRHLQGAGRDLSARQSARPEDRAQRRARRAARRARCAWTISARPSRRRCCAWRSRRPPICPGCRAHERRAAQSPPQQREQPARGIAARLGAAVPRERFRRHHDPRHFRRGGDAFGQPVLSFQDQAGHSGRRDGARPRRRPAQSRSRDGGRGARPSNASCA